MKQLLLLITLFCCQANAQEVVTSRFGDTVTIYRSKATKNNGIIMLERALNARRETVKAESGSFVKDDFVFEKSLITNGDNDFDMNLFKNEIAFYNDFVDKVKADSKKKLDAPPTDNALCKLWIGQRYDTVQAIKKLAEEYLIFELKEYGPKKDSLSTFYEFHDSLKLCEIKVWLNERRSLEGTTITKKASTIKTVTISGPAPRMERLYSLLKQRLSNCPGTEQADAYVLFNKNRIFIERGNLNEELSISSITVTDN